MHHIAIMKKSWGLLPKILSGEKVIESRWYLNKSAPWGKIKMGDKIYFKNSGEPVTAEAVVSKVLEFESLTPKKVEELLLRYGNRDGVSVENMDQYFKLFKNKKYCLLIFLKNPKEIRPFNINKRGFGSMAAWISVSDIKTIKI